MIAAVEGYAVGGGFELCLSCDLIVAARTAKFGLPEVRHNVVAIGGGLFRLPRRMPYHLAMELALTGEFRDAEFFHRHGVVNRVVDEGAALEEAVEWAEALLVNGPTALAASKEIVWHSRRLDRRGGLARADEIRPPRAGVRGPQGRARRLRREAQAGLVGAMMRSTAGVPASIADAADAAADRRADAAGLGARPGGRRLPRAGVIGAFPTKNARTVGELDAWLERHPRPPGGHGRRAPRRSAPT